MASRFPPAWVEELRTRSDIVQVISAYLPLKKSGSKYWGLCPFHGEKTASFSVDGERQLFYCFGCKAGGDVFRFMMDMEKCSFHEAAQRLADRAGIPMPEMENSEEYERERTLRDRLLTANRLAARFYHETLFRPEGQNALAYLTGRGLSDSVIRRFGIGAAPDGWSVLTDYLTGLGYSLRELSLAGLTVVRESDSSGRRAFDMFRNRAIFPIIDSHGSVLAFGGRSLDGRQPKYLNTADTPVFNKRKNIYAANLLQKQRRLEHVILVEGYMDVVSLSQFGVDGVCATLGTSLTGEQARLIHRFAPTVYLGYDGDAAGQHAILRGLDILAQEGIPARVLDFPDGLDPDEFIRRDGPEGFRSLPTLSPASYRLRRMKDSLDLSTEEGRIAYAREATAVLVPLDPVERETCLKEISVRTGFSRDVLLEQLRRSAAVSPSEPVPVPAGRKAARPSLEPGREDLAAQELLLSLLASGQLPAGLAEEEDFEEDELKWIYRCLLSGNSVGDIIQKAPDDASRSRYTRILMAPDSQSTDQMIAMARDCVARIRRIRSERRMKEISSLLANSLSEAERQALLQEAMKLSGKAT